MGTINFNTTLPSFICMLKHQKTSISRLWKFYPIPQLLHLNEKSKNPILLISSFKCFNQLTQFWRVRGMSHFMTVKFCVFRNIYNTFYDLQYHNCHTTICMGHTAMKQKVWGYLTAHAQKHAHTHTQTHTHTHMHTRSHFVNIVKYLVDKLKTYNKKPVYSQIYIQGTL